MRFFLDYPSIRGDGSVRGSTTFEYTKNSIEMVYEGLNLYTVSFLTTMRRKGTVFVGSRGEFAFSLTGRSSPFPFEDIQ